MDIGLLSGFSSLYPGHAFLEVCIHFLFKLMYPAPLCFSINRFGLKRGTYPVTCNVYLRNIAVAKVWVSKRAFTPYYTFLPYIYIMLFIRHTVHLRRISKELRDRFL
jgi:hypothetical protein